MRITKKTIALVLSVLMAVSMMPFTAFANTAANLSDIIAGADSAKYIEITDTDITVDEDTTLTDHILDLYGNVTIDLNGHNLVAGANNSSGQEVAIWINPGANVTITDSAQPSTAATYSTTTGVLTVKDSVAAISSTYYGIINEGNLTLGKVVVKGNDNAICVTAGGSLTTTEANSIVCGGTYGVTYPGGTATLNLTKGMIFGQYGLSGNSSFDSTTNAYKFGGNTINIGAAKIYGKGIDDDGSGVINGAAIVLGADDDCNITGNATIYGYDAPAIVVRASADLDITGSPYVKTYGTVTDVKVLDGATAVPSAPVVVDTACGYTKKEAIDVDIAGGTYEATATGVTNAVALVGNSGQTTADYVDVTGGTYKANGASDTSVADLIPAASGEETPKVYDNGKVVDALFEVNGNYYAHITQAINSVPTDGTATTIKLLKDVSDGGYGGCVVKSGQNVTFDLDGHTWTLRGTVGSTGTKTNGFQFLQGSTVKIKDGTITAKLATIYHVIQNYGDLTIEDATVQYTGSGVNKVAVSTNSSSTVIKNSTISVNSDGSATEPNYAINVNPGWGSYTDADVVIENSTIAGDVKVEATAANSTADVEFAGTTSFTRGEIVMSDATNGTTEVKNTGTGVAAPDGYEWVNSEVAGTKVLVEEAAPVAQDEVSLTLDGDIKVNFYVDVDAHDATKIVVNSVNKDIETNDPTATEFTDLGTGIYKATVSISPAQLRNELSVDIYNGNTVVGTLEISPYQYLTTLIGMDGSSTELVNVCKALINYAAASQQAIGFNASGDHAIDVTYNELANVAPVNAASFGYIDGATLTGVNVACKNETSVIFYYTGTVNSAYIKGIPGIQATVYDNAIEIKGIAAQYIDDAFTLTINGTDITYSVDSYNAAALNHFAAGSVMNTLAQSLANYGAYASAYFASLNA